MSPLARRCIRLMPVFLFLGSLSFGSLWLGAQSVSAAEDVAQSCTGGPCEAPAPYVLRIINSGEADARSSNATEEGRDDNRRVDVSIVPSAQDEPVGSSVSESTPGYQSVTGSVTGSAGSFWITQDPTSLERVLDVRAPGAINMTDDPAVTFEVATNYAAFIDRLELVIWSNGKSSSAPPLHVEQLNTDRARQTFNWTPAEDGYVPEPGQTLRYALRAFDTQGNRDQTITQTLQVDAVSAFSVDPSDDLTIATALQEDNFEDINDPLGPTRQPLDVEGIPINGGLISIVGQDISPNSEVLIQGEVVTVDTDGRFGIEYLLPLGEHTFDVVVNQSGEEVMREQLSTTLDVDYLFLVGLADLTVGQNHISGSVEPLAVDPQHYDEDIFTDGRLAFYLKGKIKGKYLVTAQLDTGTDDIRDVFDDFNQRDPQSIFRQLDPEQYYPVYGDDSQLIDDTNSQGKLYVRVDWDRSRLLWGNYNTNFTGTEFAPYNRSLYGAQLRYISTGTTGLGDPETTVNAFASQAQSLFRRVEFLGTGGSLYYLRDTQIVAGSEKVSVEIRQPDTERVVERVTLVEGRDYDIDHFQGRILLTRPLLSVAGESGPSIIRDEPLAGDQAFLVVDYEYIPLDFDLDETSGGVRATTWLGDHLGVGGTWVQESREGGDYRILGTDLTLKRSDQTYLKAELAQSEASQTSGRFLSDDGGLSFDPISNTNASSSGQAYGIEARASLSDFVPTDRAADIGAWAKRREAGFSTANTDVTTDTDEFGVELGAQLTNRIGILAEAVHVSEVDASDETRAAVQVDLRLTERLTASAELQEFSESNSSTDTRGRSRVAAVAATLDVSDALSLYGAHQYTLLHSGTQTSNDASTLGATLKASDRLSLNAEVSTGDRGDSALVGADYAVSSTYRVYSNYTLSNPTAASPKNTIVVGQRKQLSSQLNVYSEHQFADEGSLESYANTIGLDHRITDYTTIGLSLQAARLEAEEGDDISRTAVSSSVAYRRDKTRANSSLEYRRDRGDTTRLTQWVTTNRFEYRPSESLRWQGLFNASWTDDLTGEERARFVEAGVGFAYRPVSHDRLNLLGRITYTFDLPPLAQSLSSDERSLIASLEGLYDLSRSWSIGGKAAYRLSEIRAERDGGAWLDNDASLLATRLRYTSRIGVDANLAYRWLYSSATEGLRQGALFSIGKRVGNNLRVSVGYNWTDFDDDLSDDSFDAHGWFVNLVGAY